ncbi:hypothetical protein D3C73_1444900 [compost metagenome]
MIWIKSQSFGRFHFGGCKFIPDPAEDYTSVVHRAADDPQLFGQGITKKAPFGIRERLINYGADGSAGADGNSDNSRLDRIHTEVGQDTVAGPDHKRSRLQ